jgi:hypothetical protein
LQLRYLLAQLFLGEIRQHAGVFLASDQRFNHPSPRYAQNVTDTFLELPFPDQIKRKYFWDNCAQLYNFE